MTTTSQTTQQAQSTASATAEESRHLGQVAGQEAGNVAGEAMTQARHLADEAKMQLTDQSRTQRDRLVGTMRTFSQDLDTMASSDSAPSGFASDLVHQAADRTRQICESIDGREPTQILDDVRSFARRRPGTFLLGALAAGIIVGRVARGAKDGSSSSPGSQVGSEVGYDRAGPAYDATQAGTAFDDPLATTSTAPSTGPSTGPLSSPVTAATTAPVAPEVAGSAAPQPETGPLDVEEPGRGGYGEPGPGSL